MGRDSLLPLWRDLRRACKPRYKAFVSDCACGNRLVRVRRTFRERFAYLAVYRCRQCGRTARQARLGFLFADRSRCPLCGTERVARLAQRDGIDRMHRNIFSMLRWFTATQLYHCRFCRIQFYDATRREKSGAAETA